MNTTTTPAKISYYRLLQASYRRAEQLLREISEHPHRYHPAKKQETADYLTQLRKEMGKFHIDQS
ncbi:hypothetical protein C1X05_05225 [Laceyella sacchari]|jgi:hypothetical protein|uniref:Uncharacterized protein n=3 Tax=Laceyella TaxID=292635 RepID=A0AA45WJZ9_9BACL|nr:MULTISPECIES: hypothetical protein [Laceyella]KPC77943.1 hypothetical protein ADL26_01755 [Thermoactinomyces vulgaris]AUS08285.1 hypothetical protein C1X05_05225 [Laceyella sacchari]MRG26856.1 hypothetical protein [Laceyella tengchongensis]PRZ15998.1 hypothetical protein CLV36_103224 [Laceyella sediminis]TCW40921.1 hypothetical protein EDC32_101577 [Laceyella sacchari]